MILEEKLRIEMGKRNILPDRQAGFRRGRGTIDNVHVLYNVVGQ
mgnify:CR=1 FL=1